MILSFTHIPFFLYVTTYAMKYKHIDVLGIFNFKNPHTN